MVVIPEMGGWLRFAIVPHVENLYFRDVFFEKKLYLLK